MGQVLRWHIYPSSGELAVRAAYAIARTGQQSIAGHGAFRIVLAGGNTPQAVYEELGSINAQWQSWHVYFGDERCLPQGDPGRNDEIARGAWLDQVPIPKEQIHSIPAELGAEQGARAYSEIIKEIDEFDLVLLGLGEDGHTASLFAGHDPGDGAGAADVLAVCDAPKPPAERISMSANRLGRARKVMFLVIGEGKRQALEDWRGGADIPASHIVPGVGVDVMADVAAVPDWKPGD